MADTNLLILAREFKNLRTTVQEVLKMPVGPQGLQGEKGEKGDKGDPGPAGRDGRQGVDGRDGIQGASGRDGVDGKDGLDGKDGVSIVDVYWAADNSLICLLSDGREIDAGPLIGGSNSDGTTNVSISQWAGYSAEELKQTLVGKTFETVNKNLDASAGTLAYNVDGDLLTITYANGIVKTLAYDANSDLESVTLSGNTPEGIDLVKTFSYNISGDLISFTYS